MRGAEKALAHGMIEPSPERIEIAGHVKQTNRPGVKAKLCPGQDFEELIGRAKGSGQSRETVCQVSHQGLTLVHGCDDMQLAESGVGEFLVNQSLRDHADDRAAGFQNTVGEDSHEADVPTTINCPQATGSHGSAQPPGCLSVNASL